MAASVFLGSHVFPKCGGYFLHSFQSCNQKTSVSIPMTTLWGLICTSVHSATVEREPQVLRIASVPSELTSLQKRGHCRKRAS